MLNLQSMFRRPEPAHAQPVVASQPVVLDALALQQVAGGLPRVGPSDEAPEGVEALPRVG